MNELITAESLASSRAGIGKRIRISSSVGGTVKAVELIQPFGRRPLHVQFVIITPHGDKTILVTPQTQVTVMGGLK